MIPQCCQTIFQSIVHNLLEKAILKVTHTVKSLITLFHKPNLMFLYLELESRTPLLTNANSLEEQTATPPEVTDFLNVLQERPYSIENGIEQSLSTDSTDGESSNPVSNLEGYLRKYDNWSDWRFNIYIKTMGTFKHGKPENEEKKGKEASLKIMVEINILQAAILRKDIKMVKLISSLAKEGNRLEKLVDYEVKLEFNSGWLLSPCCKWIANASAIHLASYFHVESLKHLLIIDSQLINTLTGVNRIYINSKTSTPENQSETLNQQYQPNQSSPLHIASTSDKNIVALQFLIKKKAKVENKDVEGKTALHIAARNGCTKNVIALVFDGKANVVANDLSGETPLHQAKTSKILDIFLMKTNANKILGFEDKAKIKLFDRILQNHPSSMKSYLDKMVTSTNPDSDIQDQHLIFHFAMFHQDTTRKQNYFDKHLKLINSDCSNMLRHPLMALFTSLKWQRHQTKYSFQFFIFLVFLLIFTTHGIYCIDYLQCDDPKINENCQKESYMLKLNMIYNMTRYFSWGLLMVLIVMEILQFVSKVLTLEVKEYFTKQNMIEVAMLVTTLAFFIVQFIDDEYWLLEHLLGWALFLSWMDLTLFLARFDLFGKHIYLSWHVLKKVGWSLVVYVPSVIAFSMAFHAFLRRNEIFQGSTASIIKTLTMLLGEFDFADNFLFDKVKKDGDSNFSVQVIFIYGVSFLLFFIQ